MNKVEKDLVRRAAAAYLKAEEPEEVAEFETVFDVAFRVLDEPGERALDAAWAHGRLQADSSFVEMTPSATVIWITTQLVRALARVGEGSDLEVELSVLVERIADYTGHPSRAAGVAAELRAMQAEISELRRTVGQLAAQAEGPPASPKANTPPRPPREKPFPFNSLNARAQPVDLLLRVKGRPVTGGMVLAYELTSPSRALDLQILELESDRLNVEDLKIEHVQLFSKLERLLRRVGEAGETLLGEEIGEELRLLGQDLYLRLFPDPLKGFYRQHREEIGSLLVVSDEPWIPWELVRPDEFDDDDFLCLRYPMARWLAVQHGAASTIRVKRLLCAEASDVEGYPVLHSARAEREWLTAFVEEVPELHGEILASAQFADFTDHLKRGGFDVIHFCGHADHDADNPDRSRLVLHGRPFLASQLTGEIQRRVAEDRPLVFIDACRSARTDLALTGVGGWPDRWVRLARCGVLLCPQWAVRDSSAGTFAETFYRQLRGGATVGEAVLTARRELRRSNPTDPTYLAYSLYGFPNAVISFGSPSASERINLDIKGV